MKVAMLSALPTDRLYPQEKYLVLISVRSLSDPRATGRINVMKNFKDLMGIETATF